MTAPKITRRYGAGVGDTGRVPALDGLRGAAVLLVLLGHCKLPGMGEAAGGGVTVFFVLSGYLITGLLAAEIERTSRINLRRFYARRARRLLPALAVMLVGVGVLWAASGWPLGLYGRDAAWVAGYAENLHAMHQTEGTPPLLHAWSLAVEEHFYLVWPLVMLAFGRRIVRSPRGPLILVTVAAGLAVWRLVLLFVLDSAWGYYGDEVNAGALLIGAAVTLEVRQGRGHVVTRSAVAVILCGTALGVAVWSLDSWVVVMPLAVAVTAVALPNLPRGLGVWPLRGMGRISYGVYLWHLPLVIVAAGGIAYPVRGLYGAALGIPVAAASWFLVERPILQRGSGADVLDEDEGGIRGRSLGAQNPSARGAGQ